MNNPVGYPQLTFPAHDFRMVEEDGQHKIFDPVRKKFVVLTPEEWVRQHVIAYLHKEKGYPLSLLMVEKEFTYNKLSKRADIVACDNTGAPILLVECKSHDVPIIQEVFDQVVRYNLVMQVKILLVTNGINIYCCSLEGGDYKALNTIPSYKELMGNE
ncbi:MAG TPA: type I restriction enzyme HsdR N-terminal domain-containing protein [Bacteroidia bacterium]|nr:type I restriction enzyme HsdR N-terminal domain-containing protein [Bacteroidia bacterium]